LTTHTSKHKHELNGDWSMTGVVNQLDSLNRTLNILDSDQNKILHVDCTKVNNIDMSGLQLLHVWRECAGIRGVELRMINVPDQMHRVIKSVGLGQSFYGSFPVQEMLT